MPTDILTIDDVSLEIRIGIIMMRRRKEREARAKMTRDESNQFLAAIAEQKHALAGWPRRLGLPGTI